MFILTLRCGDDGVDGVRVRWCVVLMGAMAGGKKDPNRIFGEKASHGLFFCEMVFDAHTRCGSL